MHISDNKNCSHLRAYQQKKLEKKIIMAKKTGTKKPPINPQRVTEKPQQSFFSNIPFTFIVLLGLFSYQSLKAAKAEAEGTPKPSGLHYLIYGIFSAIAAIATQMAVLAPMKSPQFKVTSSIALAFVIILILFIEYVM